MATIPIIQLLRNNNIYSTRADARSALEGQKNNVPDGGVILARYSGTTGEQMIIKTLAGFVSNISTSENATVTIIDVEGADKNVQDAITSAINKLNKEDTAAVGQYVSSVSEENGIIKVTRRPLPSVEKSVMVGEAVTAVTQTNGEVGVEYGSINANNVSVIDSMNRFDSDNVEDVLYELFAFLNSGLGSLGAQIGALSTSSTVTLESTEGTEDGVLKVYTIRQGDREVGTINIPKDLVVTSGSVVKGTWDGNTFTEDVSGSGTSTALKLVIANQSAPVYINTLDLVKDHTSGNGIAISDTNVISVKIDGVSEEFLTVGENGVKLSGVQAAIDAAAASATTKVEKTGEGSHITVTSSKSNSDSSVTYTISESDIASEAALTAEVNDRQSADTTLQNNIDTVNSTLTTHTANTDVHVTQADKDRWNTPTDLSDYYTKTEVDSKVNDINSTIESYGQVTSQALNDLGTRMDDYGHVTSQSLNDLSTKFGDYYTKTEVDTAISNVDVTGQLQNYYTKTEVDSKDAILQTALDALSGDTKTKIDAEAQARTSGDTTLQGNIDALSSSTDTKITNETTARQEADTTLQTNIDNVNSGLTAHTADTTIHVTQADKDKWNKPTDLSNYYTKSEVNEKDAAINSTIEAYGQVTSQALNDLGTRLDDYGKVTSQSLNDLSTKFGDYYTKTEVDEAIANVDVTSQLQNYYTKAEVDGKDATIQTALDALDAHVRENEDIVSQSLNDLNNRIGDTYVKSYIDALEARIAELETKFLNMENNGLQAGEY